MLGALKVYARANQATIVTPFILAGAMSPVTVAGTLAQVLAEALAGAAFTQLIRPGAPVVFGTFAISISMQSGAPTFGTPEPTLVLSPRRSSPGGSACRSAPAARSAPPRSPTRRPPTRAPRRCSTLLAGTNFVLHAAGWLEGGLASGYEKFVMDADQLGMMHVLAEGVDSRENGQAMDAIREVGPGSHFLGCGHTQANFETAFYRSSIADNNARAVAGRGPAGCAVQRANKLWKRMLRDYEAPDIDPGIHEALDAFVAKKKQSMPDAFT